jgi:hypothetical protein
VVYVHIPVMVLHMPEPWQPVWAGQAPAEYEHVPVSLLHVPVPWQPVPAGQAPAA